MMLTKSLAILAALPAIVLAGEKPRAALAQLNVRNVLGGLEARQANDDYCEVECGVGCMPADATCCNQELGAFCQAGWECITGTSCCPIGEICTDEASKCQDDDYKICGDICIPESWPCDADANEDEDTTVDESDSPRFPSATTVSGDGGNETPFPSPTSDNDDGSILPSTTRNDHDDHTSSPTSTPSGSSGDDSGSNDDDEEDNNEDEGDGSSVAAVYGVHTALGLLVIAAIGFLA